MASIIRIKRSSVSGNPGTLGAGELAYSNLTDNGSNGGDRLYIGMGTESNGNAANHIVIGGKFFTDRLDHAAGTLTANSALVVDGDSKIDVLNVDNLTLNGNTISSTNTDGNITLTPNGDGYVTISGTNALVIPKGTTAQQAPAISGAIRFNTTNTAFEGYDGTNWSSLGGVKSVDQQTYVTALNDGNINFFSTGTNVVTVNGDGVQIKSTTTATGSNTGALQVAGGVSIEGSLYVQGNLAASGNQSSDAFLAAQGTPSGNGDTGFSFQNDGGYDTGMFSESDGKLSLYSNNVEILHLDGTATAKLGVDTLLFGSNGYNNEGTAAQFAWNNGSNGLKLYTRYSSQETISPLTGGNYLLLQSSNTALDSQAGRSSLRWRDYANSHYSQVDAQYDGVWIKNADWTGSSYQQYWHFGIDGKIGLPNSNNANSGLSNARFFAQNNNAIVLQPSSNTNAALHISNWDNTDRLNIWHDGGNGLVLGNYDNSDSVIEIGGVNGSWYDQADDIAIWAKRNGKLHLRTNNNDIDFQNDSGTITFRNSDGHLVVPGVIETETATGDVTLAASDGTERNLVFKGDGTLTLPQKNIQFYDTNNINGTRVADFGFNGNDYFFDNYNGSIQIVANDNATWSFNNNQGGTLVLPHGAILSDGSSNSILLGNGVDPVGYSQRISIGYQPTAQDGQGWDTIAIGARAGTTNQGNNAIAMGNRAGNSAQGADAIAIGSSPNSNVGGAGYNNQGYAAIAIGAIAGESNQAAEAVALGSNAGRYSQGYRSVAIGAYAGNGNDGTLGESSIAIGAYAAYDYAAINSIVLNASGSTLNANDSGLYINPIRNVLGSQYLVYNSTNKEVTYVTSTIQISGDTISATNTDGNIIIEPNGTGHISASNAQIKNVAEPTNDTDAATKYYVDAARSGLDVKQSVRLATTGDITLSGEQVIDTKMAVAGDRVLVKNQDLAKDNGIYVVAAGAWTRASDFDTNAEITSGAFTFVEDGDVNLNAGFVVTTKTVNVGTTSIDWTLFSASGTLIAGDGLVKSGYTLAVNVDASGGIEINSDALRLKATVAGDGLSLTSGVLSIGGTTDRITINSDSIDIASTYVGQTSITTLGTIGTGAWQADVIADAYIANDLTINGGTIDNTPIGDTTRSSGKFTSLAANGLVTFTNTTEAGPLGTASVVMSGGLSVAKKVYVASDLIGAGADTSTLSGFDIDGGTY